MSVPPSTPSNFSPDGFGREDAEPSRSPRRGLTGRIDPMLEVVVPPEVDIPKLPGGIVYREETDTVIDALLAELLFHARNCIRTFTDFQFAISGSPLVEPLIRRLLYDPNLRDFPWVRTRVWLVDEAAETGDTSDLSPRSARVRDLIVDASGMPTEQFHALSPTPHGVTEYEQTLREHLGWREKGHDRLDYVLLPLEPTADIAAYRGLSEASSPGPSDPARLVHLIQPCPARAALTIPMLNASRMVALYAAGRRDAMNALESTRRLPREQRPSVMALKPLAGELRWYLDRDALTPQA